MSKEEALKWARILLKSPSYKQYDIEKIDFGPDWYEELKICFIEQE